MADRKISELPLAQKVFDGDLMVAVTGYGQRVNPLDINSEYVSYVTTKIPVSGFMANAFRINEVVTNGTGVMVVPTINNSNPQTARPNTISLNVTGVAFAQHNHTVSDIVNFASGVSGQIQQIIKFQDNDLSTTGNAVVISTGLKIPLAANSKYLCELGTIFSSSDVALQLSGIVTVTGSWDVNYPTQMYGSWNNITSGLSLNSTANHAQYGLVLGQLSPGATDVPFTIVNRFTVATTNMESDTLGFAFTTNNSSTAVSGTLKKGSWFKAEKII